MDLLSRWIEVDVTLPHTRFDHASTTHTHAMQSAAASFRASTFTPTRAALKSRYVSFVSFMRADGARARRSSSFRRRDDYHCRGRAYPTIHPSIAAAATRLGMKRWLTTKVIRCTDENVLFAMIDTASRARLSPALPSAWYVYESEKGWVVPFSS